MGLFFNIYNYFKRSQLSEKLKGGKETMVKVIVGRLDNNTPVEVDGTINGAFAAGGYTQGENEIIQDVEGNEHDGDEGAEAGKGYFLVQRVKSGC